MVAPERSDCAHLARPSSNPLAGKSRFLNSCIFYPALTIFPGDSREHYGSDSELLFGGFFCCDFCCECCCSKSWRRTALRRTEAPGIHAGYGHRWVPFFNKIIRCLAICCLTTINGLICFARLKAIADDLCAVRTQKACDGGASLSCRQ